ncbi:carbohydrate ABC transporter permease [Cohnella sp. WQ 127256]|uniref:carbohydrate ABC transporter permease n=1 Tax=Cohnella sp. WQ 127256 TaxID=2938790 RepID=UPI002117E02C|nr:sugar ABC transporter permease [Cohnella sp. WQ 127256]
MNRTLRNPLTYLLFLIVPAAFYFVFFFYPVIQTFRIGFTSSNGIGMGKFIGFQNYVRALTDDPIFWSAFYNNVYFILSSIFIQIPIIIVLAVLISEIRGFRNFYKITVFLPSILSTAVVAVIWRFAIYHPDVGAANKFLTAVGLSKFTHAWLGEEGYATLAILITNAWQWTGFYVVLVLAAIFSIPKEILEAADTDGARGFRKLRSITVPLLRPVIIVIILLSITGAMKSMDIVIVMTGGGPYRSSDVMATHMTNMAFRNGEYGYGNAIANLIFVFTLVITLIFNFISKKYGDVES